MSKINKNNSQNFKIKKSDKLYQRLNILIYFFEILMIVFGFIYLIPSPPISNFSLIILSFLFILILIITFNLLSVIIHEIGHLICGLICGFEFLMFRIFNLTFIKSNNKIKRISFSISGSSGQCLLYPKNENNCAKNYIFYILGGSLLNILIGLIALLILIVIKSLNNYYLSCSLLFFSVFNFFIGFLNIIPQDKNVIRTDGMVLKEYRTNPCYKEIQNCLYISKQLICGRNLSQLDENLFIIKKEWDMQNYYYSYIAVCKIERAILAEDYVLAENICNYLINNQYCCPLNLQRAILHKLFLILIKDNTNQSESLQNDAIDAFTYLENNKVTSIHKTLNSQLILYGYYSIILKDLTKGEKLLYDYEKIKKNYAFIGDLALYEKQKHLLNNAIKKIDFK